MAEFETVRLTVDDVVADREAVPVTVVLYHAGGASSAALKEGTSLEIGRQAPCAVVIPDESLSRRHARVRLLQGQIFVEDLGSTNGTKIGDRPIDEETPVGVHDLVTLGNVAVRFSTSGARNDSSLESYDMFAQHVEDEITRSRHFNRTASVIAVRAAEVGKHAGTIAPRVTSLVGPIDRVAFYSRDVLLVLVPETDDAKTKALAETIAAKDQKQRLLAGAATYPPSATTADEIIEVARAMLRKATLDAPVAYAAARQHSRTIAPGDKAAPIVKSPVMEELYETIDRMHRSAISVLLHGENGTGKEVVARAIHEKSPRADKPLITVNCGAIPSTLIESELFGHEKGAFTGATSQKKGVFETADGGTVFLDEIGELPLEQQSKLLRVLENKTINRLGNAKEIIVDVRVIAASNRDLEELVAAGKFRQDLLFRMNAITLRIPPLRERKEEIVPLAEMYLQQFAQAAGRPTPKLTTEAYDVLFAHEWKGNVRELRNAMERAVAIAPRDTIGAEDLPDKMRKFAGPAVMSRHTGMVNVGSLLAGAGHSIDDIKTGNVDATADLKTLVRRYEQKVIEDALLATSGNQTLAAQRLRTPLRTLVHKIKSLGVNKGGVASAAADDDDEDENKTLSDDE